MSTFFLMEKEEEGVEEEEEEEGESSGSSVTSNVFISISKNNPKNVEKKIKEFFLSLLSFHYPIIYSYLIGAE